MTPLMERVILTMQALGDREVSLKEIREAGKFDGGREVAVCLHYLVNREGLVSVREVKGSRERPAVWKLTDLGRMYRPLLTVGTPPAADPAPPPASEPTPTKARRATPKKPKPAGTVADLVTEIKAEQDAEVARKKMMDPARDPRLVHTAEEAAAALHEPDSARKLPYWFASAVEHDERLRNAMSAAPPAARLMLALYDDGSLRIAALGTEIDILLTPDQTSQLGHFLIGTSGAWDLAS